MFAQRKADGPRVSLNTEKHAVDTADGVRIAPASGDDMAVRVTDFKIEGRNESVSGQQQFA
ncbi:MAG: hypothetical protein DMD40_13365 [Gemmatimonadetes bacterium]|nr:MAG: hypothetical protein DMD40_13365 [Gemmatimonadota bacterium]